MGRVQGKVAIVTGATYVDAGGLNIGGATATELAAEGAKVVVADINVAGAEALAKILNDKFGENTVLPYGLDLRNESEIEALIAQTVSTFGTIDVVVNNAGIFPGDDVDVANMTIEAWDNVMAVNVRAAMLMTKHALPHLRKNGGSVINTSSTHAMAGDSSLTGYGASKAALIALTKFTATQYGKEGVRCNAILPGTTTTPPAQQLPQVIKDIYISHTPNPDLNGPTELAKAYLFLASDDSRGINGEAIRVDGGLLAHQPFVADMVRFGQMTAGANE
ncbi:SDR family NAD(P)-dependent oxidoreductase [Gordonia amicalis]|uniref:SDR family NAD(P)-dependent oxidoreductase n=1 Tax=Gordonia amicalis TaxID=89053 RepID=UPI0002A65C2E|nr:SDR family oxidoreductase [Gordonia amicalis]MBA5849662.1 SDR family oxidoreductase [Gordonia amicalis]MDV7173821.1 SDR family oxidoreductase [Gordonia amicalis]NKX76806.1 SDR family oxidoreductase [Gordonia amicalis]UKO90859.1 SDR family oxidoreductase [Gordonia amicalis]UOG22370.1 SDR family oxidoreductase [Gordonia amicalis]